MINLTWNKGEPFCNMNRKIYPLCLFPLPFSSPGRRSICLISKMPFFKCVSPNRKIDCVFLFCLLSRAGTILSGGVSTIGPPPLPLLSSASHYFHSFLLFSSLHLFHHLLPHTNCSNTVPFLTSKKTASMRCARCGWQ